MNINLFLHTLNFLDSNVMVEFLYLNVNKEIKYYIDSESLKEDKDILQQLDNTYKLKSIKYISYDN